MLSADSFVADLILITLLSLVGDLRENVISNAHKGCGPLDLSGMTSVSKNDGVTLFRPLLPLEKVSCGTFRLLI